MFKLTLVTPEKRVVTDQEIDEITLPAHAGELNILPGHAPLMTTLGAGILKYKIHAKTEFAYAAISWGYCQVSAEGVNVLAETIETAEEIDLNKCLEHQKTDEARLANEILSDEEFEKVQGDLARVRSAIELVRSKH